MPDGGATTHAVWVSVVDRSGSAHRGIDYVAPRRFLAFRAGTPSGSTQTYELSILDDVEMENAEAFGSSASGETIHLGLVIVRGPGRVVRPSGHVVRVVDDD